MKNMDGPIASGAMFGECYKVISRSYPYSLSGELISYHFDYKDGRFNLTYKKTVDEDSILFSTDLKRAIKALESKHSNELQLHKIHEIIENRGYISLKGGEIGTVQHISW